MKRVAHITDIHLNEKYPTDCGVDTWKNLDAVMRDLANRHVDAIVVGGDVGEGSASEFFATLSGFNGPVRFTPGNHDRPEEVRAQHRSSARMGTHEICSVDEDGHYFYIYLDSSADEISRPQQSWLRQQLVSQKRVVVFIHHPVLAIETPVDHLYPLRNREELRHLLRECCREVTIFCGHYHMLDERRDGNIRQFTTPAVCYQVIRDAPAVEQDFKSFGYRIITFGDAGIFSEVIWLKLP